MLELEHEAGPGYRNFRITDVFVHNSTIGAISMHARIEMRRIARCPIYKNSNLLCEGND